MRICLVRLLLRTICDRLGQSCNSCRWGAADGRQKRDMERQRKREGEIDIRVFNEIQCFLKNENKF